MCSPPLVLPDKVVLAQEMDVQSDVQSMPHLGRISASCSRSDLPGLETAEIRALLSPRRFVESEIRRDRRWKSLEIKGI